MTDLLFRTATVVDGTGEPGYRADVLVSDGRVAAIEPRSGSDGRVATRAEARSERAQLARRWGRGEGPPDLRSKLHRARVIDATGSILCPGFVDMHAHSDLAVLTNTAHEAKLAQGVTTEVVGQDGIAYAPVDDASLAQIRRQIAAWNGNPSDDVFTWRSMAGYLDRLDRGVPTNVAVLVPQGNLRMLTVGSENRPAAPAELADMRHLLAEALDAGAIGMSSGLTYAPGMFADTAELESLCEVVADRGGYYAPHTRSYGAGALEAYEEVIGIARRTGCGLHLTHATLNFDVNTGRGAEFLDMIDAALADGVAVTMDSYPYLPGATSLVALLPDWFSSGGPDAVLERLADPALREPLRIALDETGSAGFHGVPARWDLIQVAGVADPALDEYVGRTIADIADRQDRAPVDVVVSTLLADGLATTVLMHVGHEENVRAIMRHPVHMAGSDGILVGSRPHPRAWGTFPRYLGHYVREAGVLTLTECVRQMTSAPAARLGLTDRGVVRVGAVADLVLFDSDAVADTATFEHPRQAPAGISHVLVGGELAIDGGARTSTVSGHALRRA